MFGDDSSPRHFLQIPFDAAVADSLKAEEKVVRSNIKDEKISERK